MSRPTLAELGLHLPPLATAGVGGLPPLPGTVEAQRAHARGALSRDELAHELRRSAEHWVRVQEGLDLDILVEPATPGEDLVCRYADALAGFAPGGLIRIYGNCYRRKPVIAGPVTWRAPITVGAWQAVQALTLRPVKATLTGPYTLMAWSFIEHYDSRAAACLAIARALRDEIEALVAAGARIVQLDEPALAERIDELPLAVEALRQTVDGVRAYVAVHTCREAVADGGIPALALPVDNVDVALTRTGRDPVADVARIPPALHLSLGVVPAHGRDLPAAADVAQRLRAVTATRPPETLWVTPDCRLDRATPEGAEARLAVLVEAVRAVRGAAPPADAAGEDLVDA